MTSMVYLYIWTVMAAGRIEGIQSSWINSGSYSTVQACEAAAQQLDLRKMDKVYRCVPNTEVK